MVVFSTPSSTFCSVPCCEHIFRPCFWTIDFRDLEASAFVVSVSSLPIIAFCLHSNFFFFLPLSSYLFVALTPEFSRRLPFASPISLMMLYRITLCHGSPPSRSSSSFSPVSRFFVLAFLISILSSFPLFVVLLIYYLTGFTIRF